MFLQNKNVTLESTSGDKNSGYHVPKFGETKKTDVKINKLIFYS